MLYRPITNPATIRHTFELFRDRFATGECIPGVKPLGYYHPDYRVLFHPEHGVWSCHIDDWRRGKKKDWSALFGMGRPVPGENAPITLEINVYKDDPNRRPDGRYLTAGPTGMYIGRTPIANAGKGTTVPVPQFAPEWKSELVVVDWGRKPADTEKVLLLGEVREESLVDRIVALVKTVYSIKQGTAPPTIRIPPRA